MGIVSLKPNAYCVNSTTGQLSCNNNFVNPGQTYDTWHSIIDVQPDVNVTFDLLSSIISSDCAEDSHSISLTVPYNITCISFSPTATASITPSVTPSITATYSPSATASTSVSASGTATLSPTVTPSSVPSSTLSETSPPSISERPTSSPTKARRTTTPSPRPRIRIGACVQCEVGYERPRSTNQLCLHLV